MLNLDRDERIASGLLIDASDVASMTGFLWPVYVTDELETWIQRTMPRELAVPEVLDRSAITVLDTAISAGFLAVISRMQEVMNERVSDAAFRDATEFTFDYEASWKDDERIKIHVCLEQFEGQPFFAVGVVL